jgi:hypothetical protein
LPLALSPFAGTPVAEALPALKSVLGNIKNPLETVSEPVAKGLLDALVTGAKVAGPARHLIPTPVKNQIPPHIRAMLHYFVGGGAPTDLGIKYEQVVPEDSPRYQPGISGSGLHTPIEEGFANAHSKYSEFAEAGVVPAYNPEAAIPRIAHGGSLHRAINKYFQDFETGDVYDDYRFYDLEGGEGSPPTQVRHTAILQGLANAARQSLNPKRTPGTISGYFQNDTEFRAWLALKGTPFPVVVKNPKTGVTEINVTAPRTPTGFETGVEAPELFQLMDRFRRK